MIALWLIATWLIASPAFAFLMVAIVAGGERQARTRPHLARSEFIR